MMFKYLTLIIVMLLTWQAQAVSITVNNNKNEPMANAVVWLTSEVLSSDSSQADSLYSMVQK
jgi:hypothetical protein